MELGEVYLLIAFVLFMGAIGYALNKSKDE